MAPSTKRGLTALSFDDGPHVKYTARLLDIAKAYQAKFTFFVVGEKAVKQKSLLIRMRDEGHEIGNHSWTSFSGRPMVRLAVLKGSGLRIISDVTLLFGTLIHLIGATGIANQF